MDAKEAIERSEWLCRCLGLDPKEPAGKWHRGEAVARALSDMGILPVKFEAESKGGSK